MFDFKKVLNGLKGIDIKITTGQEIKTNEKEGETLWGKQENS